VSIHVDRDERENPRRFELLALRELRQSLERIEAADVAERGAPVALNRTQVIHELRELIDALDRRVPHVERAGEASIARDAAALKAAALKRIAELEHQDSSRSSSQADQPRATPTR
jgi:hypothetical protein